MERISQVVLKSNLESAASTQNSGIASLLADVVLPAAAGLRNDHTGYRRSHGLGVGHGQPSLGAGSAC